MNDELDRILAAHKAEIHPAPERLKAQWHDAIDAAAAQERGRARPAGPGWHPAPLLWAAAVTAVLAVGIAIGYFAAGGDDAPAYGMPDGTASTALPRTVPAALDRGVQAYLRDSGRLIASLGAGAGDTELVLQMLEHNRLFEIAAERRGAPELARVLRAFEPTLVQLAIADLSPAQAEALRARLEFRMQAVLTKLSAAASEQTHTT
ncbi:MAG: hypothetical protein MJA32_10350 [Proteobacteria bacterium]|nr:hypothetical protein [Pseudomonadota bacterium]